MNIEAPFCDFLSILAAIGNFTERSRPHLIAAGWCRGGEGGMVGYLFQESDNRGGRGGWELGKC